jgi:N-acetylneuraminate synthase
LLQCNTNYTASLENFHYVQLNVLKTYRLLFPNIILGLSDHTPGHATVLGAVALGARMVEKHFTDDCNRVGPDHKFSLDPISWRDMVERTRELEAALGGALKKVEDNEKETVVLQRRSIRLNRDLQVGHIICRNDLTMLRPCPVDALQPYEVDKVIGRPLRSAKTKEQHLTQADFD